MGYRGFSLPGDLSLAAQVFAGIIQCRITLGRKPINEAVGIIRGKRPVRNTGSTEHAMQTLVKVHRLAGFFLVRVMRSKKPCLVRSCILLEHAVRRGLDAVVHVGVSKQGQSIDGHAWVTIGGVPFFESQETLDTYTVMWKG